MTEREQAVTVALMELWNEIEIEVHKEIETKEHKKEEAISKIEQMNKAKEIRKEAEEGC